MPRLVWLVLQNGRSVVAACETATRESLSKAIAEAGRLLVVTSPLSVEKIPAESVRDFVVFDTRKQPGDTSSIAHRLRI